MHDDQKPTDITSSVPDDITSTEELQREVAELMVECLNLEVAADQILADSPLYEDGLGLDSIDVLEIALVVSKRYGLQLREDNVDNEHIFSSFVSFRTIRKSLISIFVCCVDRLNLQLKADIGFFNSKLSPSDTLATNCINP